MRRIMEQEQRELQAGLPVSLGDFSHRHQQATGLVCNQPQGLREAESFGFPHSYNRDLWSLCWDSGMLDLSSLAPQLSTCMCRRTQGLDA